MTAGRSSIEVITDVSGRLSSRWDSLGDIPAGGWILASVSSLAAIIWGELFLALSTILAGVMVLDWILGRTRAALDDAWSREKAIGGVLAKASGYGVLLGIYLLEIRISGEWIVATEWAPLSTVLLVLFLLDEIDSVESHRIQLGGRPIPIWTEALQILRGAAHAVIQAKGGRAAAGRRASTEDPDPSDG